MRVGNRNVQVIPGAKGDPGDPGTPGPQNLLIQQAQPVNPPTPSLWIPLNADGTPKSIDQWQVFT